jgi:hypothetical protein
MPILYRFETKEAKRSGKKSKEIFRDKITEHYDCYDRYGNFIETATSEFYPNISKQGFAGQGLYSKVDNNKAESSLNNMHIMEYGEEYNFKVRGKRSAKNLSPKWETRNRCIMEKEKCWKDSTKRKNQYYK